MQGSMEMLLLLGGNEGNPPQNLDIAGNALQERVGEILAQSRDHWTEPWGFQDERLFLNRALVVRTQMLPAEVMQECLSIERSLGRVRKEVPGYAARPIDMDILMIGDMVITTPELQIPHPRMHTRWFALAPAADLVPGWIHPILQRTILQLLNDLRNPAPQCGINC